MPDFPSKITIDGDAPFCFVYTIPGVLKAHTGKARLGLPNRGILLVNLVCWLDVAPVGGSPAAIIDINRQGISIFSGGKLNLTSGVDNAGQAPNIFLAGNSYLTVDVDLVGTTTPGADATITMWYK